ncbi:hypothetical protein BKI52_26075 [marine bacterium AO1-C]|nr:hypothetical protein BKI52_26075 [marine bacterium AO1-C]
MACLLLLAFGSVMGQSSQKVFTQDIDNFWVAFDSIQTTKDEQKQLRLINQYYIAKGTPGLKAFMKVRNYTDKRWVKLINRFPKFWKSIRPNTLAVKSKVAEIEKSLVKLKTLYPSLKEAKMYFTVGGLNSGGTIHNGKVLIGCEIATGTKETDVSEFKSNWLKGVFKNQSLENIVILNIHEYVHTQQRGGRPKNLLARALKEGACDFITELVIGKPMQNSYIVYGRKHEEELKKQFRKEMFGKAFYHWMFNGSSARKMADLGYFMGYTICKSYYKQARNKQAAIKAIIELSYSNGRAVEDFLAQSKYYQKPIDKEALMKEYKDKQPVLAGIAPFNNNDKQVSVSHKKLIIKFSQAMMTDGYSINYSRKGKAAYPGVEKPQFTKDQKSLVLNIDLKPNKEYEFVISNRSFLSKEGFPLPKNYKIRFKTGAKPD